MAEDFKDWLRRQLKIRGLNQSQFALDIEKSGSVVNRWLTGGAKPDEQSRATLADYFGVDVRQINELVGVPMLRERPQPFDARLLEVIASRPVAIPIHDQAASAGFGQAVLEYAYWEPPRVAGRNIVGLRVHGDSMEPEIQDGDTIFIDTELPHEVGKTVVATVGDEVLVKKLRRRSGKLVLSGKTGEVPADDAKIEGVVIQLSRDVR